MFLARIEYSVRAGQIAVFKLLNNSPDAQRTA
jgi:hypothetical protein